MYTYIYIHIYTYMYIYVYIFTYICMCLYICLYFICCSTSMYVPYLYIDMFICSFHAYISLISMTHDRINTYLNQWNKHLYAYMCICVCTFHVIIDTQLDIDAPPIVAVLSTSTTPNGWSKSVYFLGFRGHVVHTCVSKTPLLWEIKGTTKIAQILKVLSPMRY